MIRLVLFLSFPRVMLCNDFQWSLGEPMRFLPAHTFRVRHWCRPLPPSGGHRAREATRGIVRGVKKRFVSYPLDKETFCLPQICLNIPFILHFLHLPLCIKIRFSLWLASTYAHRPLTLPCWPYISLRYVFCDWFFVVYLLLSSCDRWVLKTSRPTLALWVAAVLFAADPCRGLYVGFPRGLFEITL
jgi:hypothetical protein